MEISFRLTPLFASSPHAAMRRRGSKNYKNDVLIDIVAKFLPNGELGWKTVAVAYQEQSREEVLRDHADIKKHWIKKLCNEMKKPTGATGENNDRIARCIAIKKKYWIKPVLEFWAFPRGMKIPVRMMGGGGW